MVFAGSCCGSNQITPAGLILNTVQFAGYNKSYNLTGTLNVSGALSFNDTYGAGSGGINGGVIQTSNNITVGNWGGGSTLINVANTTARTITAGAGNAVNSLNIIASGQVTLSGTFLFYGGSYAYAGPGALVTTGSTLAFYGGCSTTPISPGSANYNNVSFSIFACTGATFSIAGTMNILGTLNFNNSGGTNGTITGGTLAVSGDVTGGASGFGYPFGSNDKLIKFVGSGVQNVTGVSGVWFPSVEIASSGTVNLNGNINITKNFTYTSGVLNAGTSTLRMGSGCGSSTLSTGTAQLNNLSIANTDCTGQTYNIVGTVNVLGNLLIDSGTNGPVNGGTFNVSGSSVTFTSGYGNSSLIMTGTTQSFTQTSGSLQGNITYNKSGGTLTLATGASFNSAGQNMTISAGTVNMAGKSLAVGGLLSIAAGATLTRASGALTYGSLSNLGTLNP